MKLYLLSPFDAANMFPNQPYAAVVGPDDADMAALWEEFRDEMHFGQTDKVCAEAATDESGKIDWQEYGRRVRASIDRTLAAWTLLHRGNLVTSERPTEAGMARLFAEWLVGKKNFEATHPHSFVPLQL